MRLTQTITGGLVAAALTALTTACGEAPSAQAPALAGRSAAWSAQFDTSAKGPAQEHFLRGVTNLHLFLYPDAEKAFQEAEKASPDFAMAYWGEALSHYHPIWREYERDEARAVMLKLGATPAARIAKAPTDREKAYIATLDVLYGDGDPAGRRRAYADAMEDLAGKYQKDDEALAFWALSRVVQYERTDEDLQERMRTAGIAQEVLRRQPRHLGAARYLIQSVDDPVHADLGTIAAQLILDAKPDGPEARHVPTHISAQLGKWEDMAEVNWQAFQLSMDWTARNGSKLADLNDHDYGHLLTYAQYGYLQLGKYGRARAMIDRARQDYEASGRASEMGRAFASVLSQYVVETGSAEHLQTLKDLGAVGGSRSANVQYAIGLVSVRRGDLARARQSLAALDAPATSTRIMRAEVAAAIASAEKDTKTALTLLREAAASDTAQVYVHFGPPGPYKPAHELLGETLLAANQPAEALTAFQEALRIYRGRTMSLLGASRAATATGNAALADRYAARLREIWKLADSDVPSLSQIRRQSQ